MPRRIREEGEGYIICAHCGAKLDGTEEWLAHIPCSKSGEGRANGQKIVSYN